MKRYIILSEIPFTARDWQRYGCSEAADAGYDVVPVQLRGNMGLSATSRLHVAFASPKQIVDIETPDSLEQFIRGISRSDLVLVVATVSKATRPLFRMLRRFCVSYCAFDLGCLPLDRMASLRSAMSIFEYLELRLEDAKGRLSRWRRFASQVVTDRFDYFGLQPPSMWLTAGTAVSPVASWVPWVWRARRVPIASFDHVTADALSASAEPRKIAVFLDEAFTDHPDFELLGIPCPVTADAYWTALEKIFREVERRHRLSVVVAPHPKSADNVPGYIRTRMIERGRTPEHVRDSALVMCHSSTAVSFAVLFRRPLMFLTTDQIEVSRYRGAIARMSSCFQSRRINADRFVSRELIIPQVNERLYQKYEHSYLRAPGAAIIPLWEAMRSEFEAHAA